MADEEQVNSAKIFLYIWIAGVSVVTLILLGLWVGGEAGWKQWDSLYTAILVIQIINAYLQSL
ncbi:MAG: hypothetical protein HWN67_06870 [Candidatus Helarchaeota archaeon]|nr:hypothetical protein [Candidatus Helarchaeota archaeon]